MARILEEKFRQRTSSTGSLDGMVITRDNELISLPTGADYNLAKAAAMAYAAATANASNAQLQRNSNSASATPPVTRPPTRPASTVGTTSVAPPANLQV